MTEVKKFEFNKTNNALAELSDVLVKLNGILDDKKDKLATSKKKMEEEAKDNDKRLKILRNSSESIIKNIDAVIMKLDKVLENDGTSNNNN